VSVINITVTKLSGSWYSTTVTVSMTQSAVWHQQ